MEIEPIPLSNLSIIVLPVFLVIALFYKWSLDAKNALYAVARMLLQLLLIGYFLTYIFQSESALLITLILAVMLFSSGWIALGSIREYRTKLFKIAFISIALGGISVLFLVTEGVLGLKPWYQPQFMIPLAGMIFANAMTSVSLAGERFFAEYERCNTFEEARNKACQAAMIPIINSLFAVGLVSLPGMMTGQILSGVSPLIAVRYQIMVMCMIFASGGISVACFLILLKRYLSEAGVPQSE